MSKRGIMKIYFGKNKKFYIHEFCSKKFPGYFILRKKKHYSEIKFYFIEIEKLQEELKIIFNSSEISDKEKYIFSKETEDKILNLRNKATEANIGLVFDMAMAYFPIGQRFSNLDFWDLAQEGFIGLIKAVEMFDYKKGYKFSTYAVWWIRNKIYKSIFDYGMTVRIPMYIRETMNKSRKEARKFNEEFKRIPTTSELAQLINTSEDEIKKAKEARIIERIFISRNSGLIEESMQHELFDESLSVEETIERKEIIDKIIKFLYEKYPPKTAFALECRLIGGETLAVAGKEIKLSREGMRLIEKKALARLLFKFKGNLKAQ